MIVLGPNRGPIPWQNMVLFAIDKNAQRLIDTGALLAGLTKSMDCVLKQPGFAVADAMYFGGRKERNCWMIVEEVRRITGCPWKSLRCWRRKRMSVLTKYAHEGQT